MKDYRIKAKEWLDKLTALKIDAAYCAWYYCNI